MIAAGVSAGLTPPPAIDDETGGWYEMDYEFPVGDRWEVRSVPNPGDAIEMPIVQIAFRLYGAWDRGIPVAPGGVWGQPAKALRVIELFRSHLKRAEARYMERSKNTGG